MTLEPRFRALLRPTSLFQLVLMPAARDRRDPSRGTRNDSWFVQGKVPRTITRALRMKAFAEEITFLSLFTHSIGHVEATRESESGNRINCRQR